MIQRKTPLTIFMSIWVFCVIFFILTRQSPPMKTTEESPLGDQTDSKSPATVPYTHPPTPTFALPSPSLDEPLKPTNDEVTEATVTEVKVTEEHITPASKSPMADQRHPPLDASKVHDQRASLLTGVYGRDPGGFGGCPGLDDPSLQRYAYLQSLPLNILLGANTFNTEGILPTQIKAMTDLILYLHRNASFGASIHESGSSDKTGRVLTEVMRPLFQSMGMPKEEIYITSSQQGPDWNRDKDQRIPLLVDLRNLVISHLWNTSVSYDVLIFFNDVFYCVDDLLELIHQHVIQSADITCAMDWQHTTKFYDLWVARDIMGEMFYPSSVMWGNSVTHFPDHPLSKSRYEQRLPLQVYSCWNGVVVFSAQPFVKEVRFRVPNTTIGECRESEATRVCKGEIIITDALEDESHVTHQIFGRSVGAKSRLFLASTWPITNTQKGL